MRADIAATLSFFSQSQGQFANFDVVEGTVSTLEASKPFAFLSYFSSVAKVCEPNITLIGCFLKGRGGLDRPAVSVVMKNQG